MKGGYSLSAIVKQAAAIHRSVARGVGEMRTHVVGRVSQTGILTLFFRHTSYFPDQYRLMVKIAPEWMQYELNDMQAGKGTTVWYGLGLAIGHMYQEIGVKQYAGCPMCGKTAGHSIEIEQRIGFLYAVYKSYRCLNATVFDSPILMSKNIDPKETVTFCKFGLPIPPESPIDRFSLHRPYKKGEPNHHALARLRHWETNALAINKLIIEAEKDDRV